MKAEILVITNGEEMEQAELMGIPCKKEEGFMELILKPEAFDKILYSYRFLTEDEDLIILQFMEPDLEITIKYNEKVWNKLQK